MPFDPTNPGDMGKAQRPVRKNEEPGRPVRSRSEQTGAAHSGNPAGRPRASTGNPPVRRTPGGENPPARRPRPQQSSNLPERRRPSGEHPVRRPPVDTGRAAPPRKAPAASQRGGYQPKYASKTRKNTIASFQLNPKMLALIVLLVLGSLTMVFLSMKMSGDTSKPQPSNTTDFEIPPLETKLPELPQLVSSAKITVTGDLLPHKVIYSKGSAIYKDEQDYDFSPIFKYLKGYSDTADYAVANLETSLFGPGKPYSGNPKLNTPDQIVDGAKGAGFDMLLTANNHCNDTGLEGVLRTVKVVREKGLVPLGTNLTSEEQKYHIQELNGIKIGMLCYTYEDSQDPNIVTFNYNALPKESSDLVCSFPKFVNAKSRDPFYQKLSEQISEMKSKGAEAIVLFLHWGEEYKLDASQDQKQMAQKLCDLGVDLIVGGHPHVVEPVELLTSTTDPDHKTVCLYSLGNAVSNQMREEMTSQKSGHTEDGMLFNFTFQKYSDNSVYLSSVEVIPTWVHKYQNSEEKREYNILPLEDSRRDQWQSMFSIDDATYQKAVESYGRTMNIVGAGLEASNVWLSQQLPHREEVPAETTVGTETQP